MHVLRGCRQGVAAALEILLSHQRAVGLVEQQRTFSRGQDDAAQIASPTGRRRVRCSHIEMIVRKETREHFRIAAIFLSTPRAPQIALVFGVVAAGLTCTEPAGETTTPPTTTESS